ncbi:MAG: hypothetical protein JSV04_05155 [Candidatus Heimdallarchaeota archaeon]|nr:MAG: hypothetical protein JSV04_05155 [Candidatus Heimdallarchaeota archaeon]
MSDKSDEFDHRKMAANLFNNTWDLIDKKERSIEEEDEMINSAHTSRYHWGVVVASGKDPKAGPLNLQRGDWQISRVYSILKRYEPALYHAKRCLDISLKNEIKDFDLAFAYEAMARAYSLVDDKSDDFSKYLELAEKAGEKIKKTDDKEYFFSELKSLST